MTTKSYFLNRFNVWTYGFLATAVAQSISDHEDLQGTYQIAPDLFVRALAREGIEDTIADLLRRGNLEEVLNPTILAKPTPD